MAIKDITDLMNSYRECSRNLWNVYLSRKKDIGAALDAFEHIRELLFDSIVLNELSPERGTEDADMPHILTIVPRSSSVILIKRLSGQGEAGYWDQEKDMVVGPNDITLAFIDYFDFSQIAVKDLRYYRCKVLSFPSHAGYSGREALLEVTEAKAFHEADHDRK